MRIPLEQRFRERYHDLLEEIFEAGYWSEGRMLARFETAFGDYVKLPARAVSSGGAALLAVFEYLRVRGGEVVVPANTFWATPQAARKAGARVVYADCNREDLCLSLEDLQRKVTPDTRAVCVVHIGGHIAFEIEQIAAFCQERDIPLVEDCAHVHGGWWKGRTGGHYGLAGAYSFYATKTMPLGEGGAVVSRNQELLHWLERYRNYGKEVTAGQVTYPIQNGFNFRMSEFAAALGIVQIERLPAIVEWKRALAAKYDRIFEKRVRFPEGMESGYYKYIVFDADRLRQRTGQVFGPGDLGPVVEGVTAEIPNTQWIARRHACPPIWYGWEHADADVEGLRGVLL